MISRISTAVAERSTAAKLVGTLGVLAASATVAGLGTFGEFTDSATADTAVDTGVLSIDLDPAAGMTTMPFSSGAMFPGDVERMAFDLVNDGEVPLSSVTFASKASTSSLLDTDPEHGLQMTVQSCSAAWTVSGAQYSCSGEVTDFYAGPIVMAEELPGALSLTPGGVDHMLATVSFPTTAGNDLLGQTSRLAFTFTAAQRDGAAR